MKNGVQGGAQGLRHPLPRHGLHRRVRGSSGRARRRPRYGRPRPAPSLALDRPGQHGRPHLRFRGPGQRLHPGPRRLGVGRRLQVRERRDDLGAHLRPLRLRLHRRRRLLPERPEHHLGRHGRGMRPQQRRLGRRRLQIDRRRQDVRPDGPRDDPDDRPRDHPSDRPRHRLRRGLRPSLGLYGRARPVQDDRRRQVLDEARRRPAERRQDRGHRPGHAPGRPRDALRRLLAAAPPALAVRFRRPELRHLQDDRRRQVLDEADPGTSAGRARPHRPGHLPLESPGPHGRRRGRASSPSRRSARGTTRSPTPNTTT